MCPSYSLGLNAAVGREYKKTSLLMNKRWLFANSCSGVAEAEVKTPLQCMPLAGYFSEFLIAKQVSWYSKSTDIRNVVYRTERKMGSKIADLSPISKGIQ